MSAVAQRADDWQLVRGFLVDATDVADDDGCRAAAVLVLEAFDRLSGVKAEAEVPMVRVRTNAPRGYDYGYCQPVTTEVGDMLRLCGRFVDMPVAHVEYQTDRYRSEMYFVEVVR